MNGPFSIMAVICFDSCSFCLLFGCLRSRRLQRPTGQFDFCRFAKQSSSTLMLMPSRHYCPHPLLSSEDLPSSDYHLIVSPSLRRQPPSLKLPLNYCSKPRLELNLAYLQVLVRFICYYPSYADPRDWKCWGSTSTSTKQHHSKPILPFPLRWDIWPLGRVLGYYAVIRRVHRVVVTLAWIGACS